MPNRTSSGQLICIFFICLYYNKRKAVNVKRLSISFQMGAEQSIPVDSVQEEKVKVSIGIASNVCFVMLKESLN